ncbi:zinc-binding dehydrogenase [Mycolicibacterium sphagni]|uniref:Enoyl reductase (ER) domain-containing protein n=1 Tax=Mycolicibacterium sphagni TaxID=1786 RepID=A0A255DG19_9MYCO|nr:zinc-binding dehydrogenase [Mycolicibacterium sphagni]OYN76175.1 hypothetical protein CG716_22770 [Mycolicibacterium sphagni]
MRREYDVGHLHLDPDFGLHHPCTYDIPITRELKKGQIMPMKAAVVREHGTVKIEEVQIPEPGRGEVRVRMVATGLCQTDVMVCEGGFPATLPVVLGHEGAGVVDSVGPGVTGLAIGDKVLMTIVMCCGYCFQCERGDGELCETLAPMAMTSAMLDGTVRLHDSAGVELHHSFCQSSLAEFAVVPQEVVTKVRDDAPLDLLCVLACGATTGIGAVLRRAKIEAGAHVLVVGAGGVGLAAVAAARLAGASTILVSDPEVHRRDVAINMGATHTIDPLENDLVAKAFELTGRGMDYAFDAAGAASTFDQSLAAIRAGGEVVLLAIHALTDAVSVPVLAMLLQKRVTGSSQGSIKPHTDLPILVDLVMSGKLALEPLIARRVGLDELPGAMSDMQKHPGRTVVVFPPADV